MVQSERAMIAAATAAAHTQASHPQLSGGNFEFIVLITDIDYGVAHTFVSTEAGK